MHLLAPLPFIILYLFNPPYIILILILSAIIHELGHITAIRLCKGEIRSFELFPFGAKIIMSEKLLSYKADALIFSAGALFNLALACAAFIAIRIQPCRATFFLFFCNVFFAFFNLLPIEKLDGAELLRSFILQKAEPGAADRIMNTISSVFLLAIGALAILTVYITGFNISLLIIVIELALLTKKNKGRSKLPQPHIPLTRP